MIYARLALAFANAGRERGEAALQEHERAAALRGLPILAELSDDALERVARSCAWRRCEAGEEIIGYQDPSTDVFFLLAGKARAIIYSADGKAVVFVDLKPATVFGEVAAIDRRPRSASIEALEPCAIASLSAEQFEKLLRDEPKVALATLRHVAADVRRLSERVFEFSTLVVRSRIHAELLRLACHAGAHSGMAVLAPAPSLSDIAGRISTHREAVSREFSRLTGIGLLRREGGNLCITDVAKLAEFVNEAKGE
jgi:CRP/FNR family cyclic AMP-dependent transcriptional regulator